MTTYNDSTSSATTDVQYFASTYNNYSHGKSLTDLAIWAIVKLSITSGGFPLDTNGIYYVISSADVLDIRCVGRYMAVPLQCEVQCAAIVSLTAPDVVAVPRWET